MSHPARFKCSLALALLLPLLAPALAQATEWSFDGRQTERRSTSPTELLVDFTLRGGESPVGAVVECAQATRRAYAQATFVSCAAFTPAAYRQLSGKLRLCDSARVQWFGGETPYYRLYLPQEDARYPASCPALDPA